MDIEEELLSPYPSESGAFSFEAVPGSPVSTPPGTPVVPPTGSPMSTMPSVTKPPLGGLYKDDVVWIGGPPKADFSGPYLLVPRTPLWYRNLDASTEIKGYAKRTEGLDPIKFKRDDPDFGLLAFASAAHRHMKSCGMDTVFYMQGVDDAGQNGHDLFNYHTRYTLEQVEEFIEARLADQTYDQFQMDALDQSAEWLSNSLDESLKSSLRTQLAFGPSGPVLWMHIVAEVQSNSLSRCDDLNEKFRTLSLSQFKGENVHEYAKAAGDILTQLERDEQLSRTHLLRIVDVFCACTVADFRIHWMGRRDAVEKFIQASSGKDPATRLKLSTYTHFTHLLKEGKDKFMNLQAHWGPAKGVVTQAMFSQLQAQMATINQKLKAKTTDASSGTGDKDKKELKCYDCGKPGYTKRNCPDCKAKREADKGKNPPKSDGKGKWAAPKDGEPTEKKIDDVLYKWCAKCRRGKGRWTKDHTTAEHKDGFFKEKTPPVAANVAQTQNLFSAWAE